MHHGQRWAQGRPTCAGFGLGCVDTHPDQQDGSPTGRLCLRNLCNMVSPLATAADTDYHQPAITKTLTKLHKLSLQTTVHTINYFEDTKRYKVVSNKHKRLLRARK